MSSPPPPPPSPVPEIAFFDVETTIPQRAGAGYALLEFGAIVVCPRRLVEVASYSTLIRPADLSAITAASERCNGITAHSVASAPSFADVAGTVFEVLNGRVWAGHNIVRFDCVRIKEAFEAIGRPAPEAVGFIDTLPLLTRTFGRRAGNMKMATLATYFGLGHQRHRSLDDVRLNLEVLKYCATVLFLEASVPDVFSMINLVNGDAAFRSADKNNVSPEALQPNLTTMVVEDLAASSVPVQNKDPSDLATHLEQVNIDSSDRDNSVVGNLVPNPDEMLCENSTAAASEGCSGYSGFSEPDEVMPQDIKAPAVFSPPFGRRIVLLHRDSPLQLCCLGLKVHFGVSTKFMDHAGRPKLNIVVEVPEKVCQLLDACDQLAQRSSQTSGSNSQWRPVLRIYGYSKPPTVRLHIPTVASGDGAAYSTEISQKDPFGNTQKLSFSTSDDAHIHSLFVPGTVVDAYFCADTYDFQRNAGIRLVAKRLVIQSKLENQPC